MKLATLDKAQTTVFNSHVKALPLSSELLPKANRDLFDDTFKAWCKCFLLAVFEFSVLDVVLNYGRCAAC